MKRTGGMETGTDRGFTLVELLIVIVILGILATVTVFAVRGITAEGQENACSVDLKNLATAEEAHWALNGSYADEATLVSSGSIAAASDNFDVTSPAGGESYAIDPAPGSQCTGSTTGGETAAGPAVPPVVAMVGASEPFHGVNAIRYPNSPGGSPPDQIVVFGRDGARADWVAAHDAGVTTTRRTHFVDMNGLNSNQVDDILDAVENSGITTIVVFASDDTAVLPGAGENVLPYVQREAPNHRDMIVEVANYDDGQLASTLANAVSPNN